MHAVLVMSITPSCALQVFCMLGLGLGMGLVDGSCPAMLAERTEARHDGTGVVYTLSTASTQFGFLLGPVGGSLVMASSGFGVMCLMLGGVMWLYSPLLQTIYDRREDTFDDGDRAEYSESLDGDDEERDDLLGESKNASGRSAQR